MAVIYGKDKKWTKTALIYKFSNSVSSDTLSQNEAETEFQKACDQWAEPSGLSFNMDNNADNPDILITWEEIDNSGDILADSGSPDGNNTQVKMRFDTSEEWTNNNVVLTTISFFSVALHELGHAIGLAHSGMVSAVMYPIHLDAFVAKSKLTTDDSDGAEYLYKDLNKGIMIVNEMDKYVSWYAFNSNDGVKLVPLGSGNLAPNEIKFYEPVKNGTGKYFIRITQRGGGTELAGAIVPNECLCSVFSVGSTGVTIQVT